MNYKARKKLLNQRDPWPTGFEVTVYNVPKSERATAMSWVFNKFENVIKIVFVD